MNHSKRHHNFLQRNNRHINLLTQFLIHFLICKNGVSEIQPRNYTSILKTVHENIDSYVGKKICFTGYVYRVLDLQDNQFVLARDMIVSSNSQSVVLGNYCCG